MKRCNKMLHTVLFTTSESAPNTEWIYGVDLEPFTNRFPVRLCSNGNGDTGTPFANQPD
jgi:hypothetical protein